MALYGHISTTPEPVSNQVGTTLALIDGALDVGP